MPKCRDVTRLLTLENEQPLSPYRKATVFFHLAICRNCRRHQRQLKQIRTWLDQQSAAEIDQASEALSAEARARISDTISKAK